MRYLTRATVALAAVIAAITLVSTALAVHPKKGVTLAGKTSMPNTDTRMVVKVSSSGKKVNIQFPSLSHVSPPQLKNVKVSDAGKFSVTRQLDQTGGYYAATEWNLKVSGKFTAPTKAKGTFSMKEFDPRGNGTRKSGKQTFKVKLYK